MHKREEKQNYDDKERCTYDIEDLKMGEQIDQVIKENTLKKVMMKYIRQVIIYKYNNMKE